MNLPDLLSNKAIKAKEKVDAIAQLLTSGQLKAIELQKEASKLKAADKANCIEAMEAATKTNPGLMSAAFFDFVIQALEDAEPRVKWEAARVIGNTAAQFPKKVSDALPLLLQQSNHKGTVVRWSAAFALVEILKLKSKLNATLIPEIELAMEKEEKNSIKKIYAAGLKKAKVNG